MIERSETKGMGKRVYMTDKQIDVIWKVICFIEERIADTNDDTMDDGMVEDYNELKKLFQKCVKKKA